MTELVALERSGDVYILTMTAGENRWNTGFVRAFDAALDEVAACEDTVALVTASKSEKFFSNGIDLDWAGFGEEHPPGDRGAFGTEYMALLARIMTFPMPTVAAVNGHAFGAGFMVALCHDLRVMREDRGFMCANEVELGMTIPDPELAMFRTKIPAGAFHESVILARRWSGVEALQAGIVQTTAPLEDVRPQAEQIAKAHLRLSRNRDVLGKMKERIYGQNAALNEPHGAAYMLRHPEKYRGDA